MKKSGRTALLLLTIGIEGYVVLASELLAIRQTVPYVGSGTDTVSVIIAAVLLPLALGYHRGGSFRAKSGPKVRNALMRNIAVAIWFLALGLSQVFMSAFFYGLIAAGINHRLVLISLYSLIFLAVPVYLLGQTVPLVSNYFSRRKLSEITGRMLCFSTAGSFGGALFTTLVLMSFFGVHVAAAFTVVLLSTLPLVLGARKRPELAMAALAAAALAVGVNSPAAMRARNVVSDNPYNTVRVYTDADGARNMSLNDMLSSKYSDDGRKHAYVEHLERRLIDPIRESKTPRDILVIGAGAFTLGLEDKVNRYDYVDIDGSLKKIAENLVLRQKLSPNKTFIPAEARAFLIGTKKSYDLIVLDVYLGGIAIPEHLVTREFFLQVRGHLKPGGYAAMNLIGAPALGDALSRHVDDTFRSAFPRFLREAVQPFDPWRATPELGNVIYIAPAPSGAARVYTDDRNTLFLDKPQAY